MNRRHAYLLLLVVVVAFLLVKVGLALAQNRGVFT